jgi:hypothetical protein
MTTEPGAPEVRTAVHDHVCAISLDNVAKKNTISPDAKP